VCRQTGERIHADNPPVALPNGRVYSHRAVRQLLSRNGVVTCPATGETFALSEAQPIYII
jgi:macrophage erythroblast attacher